jgi:hypothetical protein
MDITKMSVVELKALAYDTLVQMENNQQQIRLINDQISKLSVDATPAKEVEEAPTE